ncbi:MAG TPA: hypothetical protein P5248_09020 [Bacteroidales bacterium]|nr:hypothetical protein [Bacteroidales bacterium]
MMNRTFILSPRFAALSSIILLAALSRLLPHWPNFTPVAAIALFGGAHYGKRMQAFLVPLAALFLSDLVLGFHHTMWAVYLGFVLTVIFGLGLRGKVALLPLSATVMGSSVVFFLLTNFGSWLGSPFYAQTMTGLLTAYTAGLPFFLNSLAGDLFFSGALFGSFYWLQQRYPALRGSGLNA